MVTKERPARRERTGTAPVKERFLSRAVSPSARRIPGRRPGAVGGAGWLRCARHQGAGVNVERPQDRQVRGRTTLTPATAGACWAGPGPSSGFGTVTITRAHASGRGTTGGAGVTRHLFAPDGGGAHGVLRSQPDGLNHLPGRATVVGAMPFHELARWLCRTWFTPPRPARGSGCARRAGRSYRVNADGLGLTLSAEISPERAGARRRGDDREGSAGGSAPARP